MKRRDAYGYLAAWCAPDALLDALRRLHAAGYRRIDAYTPYPLDELDALLPARADHVRGWALLGGLLGGLGTLALEYYSAVIDYPIRVGGRPYVSWPAFLPPALEMMFLFAALAAVLAMLVGNRLPRLHHPVFDAACFGRASQDLFVLVVSGRDPCYDADHLAALLAPLHPAHAQELAR